MLNCSNYSLEDPQIYSPINVFQEYKFRALVQRYFSTSYSIKHAIVSVWFVLGLFGNYLSYRIWSTGKIRRENSSAIYLVALSLSDLAFLIVNMAETVNDMTGHRQWKDTNIVCEVFNIFNVFTQYYPVMLIFAFTVERYVAIRFPFHRGKLCTQQRALCVVLILGLVNLLSSIGAGMIWNVNSETNECEASRFSPTYIYFTEVLIGFVLPLCTLCANSLLILELRRITRGSAVRGSSLPPVQSIHNQSDSMESGKVSCQKQRLSFNGPLTIPLKSSSTVNSQRICMISSSNTTTTHQMEQAKGFRSTTFMLLTVSFFLILTVLPASIVMVLQSFYTTGNECVRRELMPENAEWKNYFLFQSIKAIVDALVISHYACNFIIYALTSSVYRSEAVLRVTCGRYHIVGNSFIPTRTRLAPPISTRCTNNTHVRHRNPPVAL